MAGQVVILEDFLLMIDLAKMIEVILTGHKTYRK